MDTSPSHHRHNFLVALALVALGSPGAFAEVSMPPPERYSLVISGGVSLGAYEAGLLWALTRLVEQANGRIVGVAGASAGAINGMLTALAVCSAQGTPGDAGRNPLRSSGWNENLFYEAWTAVGAGDLLPSEARDGSTGGDGQSSDGGEGVLKRDLVDRLFTKLLLLIDRTDIWRPGCALPFAVTVTRAVPTVRTEAGIPAPVQRFAIPLKLVTVTSGGVARVTFENQVDVLRRAREAGDVLFLAERKRYDHGLHPQDVLDTVRASSSFPLAFGPTELTVCVPPSECPEDLPSPTETARLDERNSGYSCAEVNKNLANSGLNPWRVPGQTAAPLLAPCTSRFVDGGVFDNTPLGLAVAQSESTNETDQPITYLYVDPDLRRHGPEATLKPNVGRRGVRRVGAVLSEVVGTARGQALHDALRYVRFNASLAPLLGAAARSLTETTELLSDPAVSPTRKAVAWNAASPREIDALNARLVRARRELDDHQATLAPGLDSGATRRHLEDFVGWAAALLARVARYPALDKLQQSLREPLELAQTVLEDPREARRLVALRRYAPLAASQLANFGAFLDLPFRQHDFAAGVYDAAEGLAEHQLRNEPKLDDSQKTARQIDALGLGGPGTGGPSADVAALVHHFWALEWDPYDTTPDKHEGCKAEGLEHERATCTVARALQSQPAACETMADTSPCFDDPPFGHFLEELRERDYQPVSDEMRSMLENRQWWALLTARALLRLSEIEQDELAALEQDVVASSDQTVAVRRANEGAAEAQEALVSVVRQSAYWLRAYADARDTFELDPSTVPDDGHALWAWHLLPYWLELDPVRAGAGIGYEPGFSWGWSELRLRLAAARYWVDDHVTPFVVRKTLANHGTLEPCGASFPCDREHHASSALGLTLAFPDLGTRMLSLGLGAEADLGWRNRLVQLGGSVYVGTLLDRLRFKVGVRVAEWDVAGGGAPYLRRGEWLWDLRLELADLNGILWEAAH